MVVKTAWGDGEAEKPPIYQSQSSIKSTTEKSPPTLREFTQNTTFHGVKYVFDDTTWFRKIFWALVILGSVTFFVVQVGLRVREYYKYQTVTSVKRVTSDVLPFPAVTLCNLNQYKISEAFDRNLYHYLDRQLQTNVKINDSALESIANTSETIRSLGHQLHQLIDSCEWQGKPCDLKADFMTRLLDIGLCYTFNYDVNNRKNVSQPGMEGGLKLMMNIEVFEHMRGSNLDSGVKFLLHEPGEMPSLRNLGFVATSGEHTFVAIKHGEVHSLPAPWGDCIEKGEAVADCQHKCFTEDYIRHCNCTDTSMKNLKPYKECDLPTKLTCGCDMKNSDQSTCGLNCTCPSPCKELIYKPTLSSSGLSATNIDMFVLRGPGVYNRTRKSFLKATETRTRLSSTFESYYANPAKTLVSSFKTIKEIHNHYKKNNTEDPTYMELLLPFGQSFYHSKDYFDPRTLLANIKTNLEDYDKCAPEMYLGTYHAVDWSINLLQIMEIELGVLMNDPDQCMGSEAYQTLFEESEEIYNEAKNSENGCIVEWGCLHSKYLYGEQDCSHVGRGMCIICHIASLQGMIEKTRYTYPKTVQDENYVILMNERIESAFDPYIDFDDKKDEVLPYEKLCKSLQTFVIEDTKIFPILLDNITAFIPENLNMSKYINFLKTTFDPVSGAFHNASNKVLEKKYSDVCCWQPKLLSHEFELQYYNWTKYEDSFMKGQKEAYNNAVYLFQSMSLSEFVGDMHDLLMSSLDKVLLPLEPKMKLLQIYGDYSNYSTHELIIDYFDPSVQRQTSSVIAEVEREIETLVKIQRTLEKILANMEDFTASIETGTIIPLLEGARGHENVAMLAFLKNPKTAEQQKYFGTQKCNNWTFTKTESEDILLYCKIACTMSEHLLTDINAMTNALREFELNYNSIWRVMTKYYEATIMDESFYLANFMQVDLYYETLQYEVTEEQEAFVIGSLFSEVGGFLGLLLGASIITVLEIIDYILLIISQKMNKGKNVAPALEKQQKRDPPPVYHN